MLETIPKMVADLVRWRGEAPTRSDRCSNLRLEAVRSDPFASVGSWRNINPIDERYNRRHRSRSAKPAGYVKPVGRERAEFPGEAADTVIAAAINLGLTCCCR